MRRLLIKYLNAHKGKLAFWVIGGLLVFSIVFTSANNKIAPYIFGCVVVSFLPILFEDKIRRIK